MDVLIDNKDIALGHGGVPIMIDGIDELKQKLEIALRSPRGAFIYDRGLGAFEDGFVIDDDTLSSAEMQLNECFAGQKISVRIFGAVEDTTGLRLSVSIFDGYNSYDTEVYANG